MYRFFSDSDETMWGEAISENILKYINRITNIKPIKGFVYEYNLPLWFDSKEKAEEFRYFLEHNYKERFDWNRVKLEQEQKNIYKVDILSKSNVEQFCFLFNLQSMEDVAAHSDSLRNGSF